MGGRIPLAQIPHAKYTNEENLKPETSNLGSPHPAWLVTSNFDVIRLPGSVSHLGCLCRKVDRKSMGDMPISRTDPFMKPRTPHGQ